MAKDNLKKAKLVEVTLTSEERFETGEGEVLGLYEAILEIMNDVKEIKRAVG